MTVAAATQTVLKVRDLVVRYGSIEALHGVSLQIERGRIVCLIGANGAGKSSLLRAISGLTPIASGEIVYCDQVELRCHKTPAHRMVAAGISHVPEGRGIFANMRVEENLMLGAYLRRDAAVLDDRDRVLALFPRLRERLRQMAGTLSGGEQQMLAIGRALMSRPKMLLLDEPSLGLAPILVEQIFQVIQQINATGTTVLLVEQNAHMALSIAHYAYVLETGTIALEGPAKDVRGNDSVRKAYLGEE